MPILKGLAATLGTLLGAAALYAILAAPGFVSDRDSTVPLHRTAAP